MNRSKLEAMSDQQGVPELSELVANAANADLHTLIPELPFGRSDLLVSASITHGSMLTAIRSPWMRTTGHAL